MTKFFHSSMPGAPTLSGTAGALTDLLDACLVSGFGTKSVSGLVVSGGVATMACSSPHAAVVGSTVLVSGATPSGLNGEKVVTAISSTSVSFATALVDQTATGTISFKIAALGWTIAQTATNTRAYKPTSAEATGCILRIDDTSTTVARALGYESLSDINTGTGKFPRDEVISGGFVWPKSEAGDTNARRWMIFGDDRCFYISISPHSGFQAQAVTNFFGDFNAQRSGDAYACMLTGAYAADVTYRQSPSEGEIGGSIRVGARSGYGAYVARSHTGLGGPIGIDCVGQGHISGSGLAFSGGAYYGSANFPNPSDNGLLLNQVSLFAASSMRGILPGVWHCPQYAQPSFVHGDIVDGFGTLAGRKLMAVVVSSAYANSTGQPNGYGVMFMDLTGPWRS